MHPHPESYRVWLTAAGVAFALISGASAGGFYNAADARSAALGGEEAAQSGSVLSAMDSNPAALATMPKAELAITLTGALLSGEFQAQGRSASLHARSGFVASGAVAIPSPNDWPVRFGLAVIPDLTLDADWRYLDAAGGLGGGTSYGAQTQHARILSLRTTAAVAASLTRWLSLGVSGGFIYNQNFLDAPYVFQSQPVLAGFKTLLDLKTDGYAPAFDFGAQLHPSANITVGLSYRPRTVIRSSGRARGNASAQLQSLGSAFAAVAPLFSYDAEVRVELPQRFAVGIEWQALDRLRLVAGRDWINWSEAFDELRIDLSNGSNPAINGVVGSDSLTDIAPCVGATNSSIAPGRSFASSKG